MDQLLSFSLSSLGIRGRFVRLGRSLKDALGGHGYPRDVEAVLGEACALGVVLSSLIKGRKRLGLQTESDGPLGRLVVQAFGFEEDIGFRGYGHVQGSRGSVSQEGGLLGRGHLGILSDPLDGVGEEYRGLVPLTGTLEEAAHRYFAESEQIPTRIFLTSTPGAQEDFFPEATGFLIQKIPKMGGNGELSWQGDEGWEEAEMLLATLGEAELGDRDLEGETLLARLFGACGDIFVEYRPVKAYCPCSRGRILDMLSAFSQADRSHMVKDGSVEVTCEFCSKVYGFGQGEIGL